MESICGNKQDKLGVSTCFFGFVYSGTSDNGFLKGGQPHTKEKIGIEALYWSYHVMNGLWGWKKVGWAKALDGGGGAEARTRCGDMFICLLFIISVEVTLLISLISQSPISPIKF